MNISRRALALSAVVAAAAAAAIALSISLWTVGVPLKTPAAAVDGFHSSPPPIGLFHSSPPPPCVARRMSTAPLDVPVWTFGGSGKDASYDGGGAPVVQPESRRVASAALPPQVSADPQIASRLESGMSSPPTPAETSAGRCQFSAEDGYVCE